MKRFQWKRLVVLGLMFMVLIKLIEIQMRSYPLVYSDGVWNLGQVVFGGIYKECVSERQLQDLSPYYTDQTKQLAVVQYMNAPAVVGLLAVFCHDGILEHHRLMRTNQVLFGAAIFLIGLYVRLLTGSWVAGSLTIVLCLTRGRLLRDMGVLGVEQFITFFIYALLVLSFIYSRSAQKSVKLAGSVILFLLCLLDTRLSLLLIPWWIFINRVQHIGRIQRYKESLKIGLIEVISIGVPLIVVLMVGRYFFFGIPDNGVLSSLLGPKFGVDTLLLIMGEHADLTFFMINILMITLIGLTVQSKSDFNSRDVETVRFGFLCYCFALLAIAFSQQSFLQLIASNRGLYDSPMVISFEPLLIGLSVCMLQQMWSKFKSHYHLA